MNSKTGVALSIVAIAAVIALFASGQLAANQAQAFRFGGFHHFGLASIASASDSQASALVVSVAAVAAASDKDKSTNVKGHNFPILFLLLGL